VLGIEERLHAIAIARREQLVRPVIPDRERVFAAQSVHALRAEVLVEVQCDLAVRARAQAMCARRLELRLHSLVVVELAVGDDPHASILAGDGLIAGREVDDAEARVAERGAAARVDPSLLTVGAAMLQRADGAIQGLDRDLAALTKDCNDAAHAAPSRVEEASGGLCPPANQVDAFVRQLSA